MMLWLFGLSVGVVMLAWSVRVGRARKRYLALEIAAAKAAAARASYDAARAVLGLPARPSAQEFVAQLQALGMEEEP